jgi:DNA-binding NtrC family response regulator
MTNQARLLYTLETGTYYPVGSIESRKCNFRIITATHSNLPLKVRLKSFREDLYYRLSSIQIVLSPLRERAEDIPVIANLFWKEINPLHADLNEEFLAYLMKRSWPGNVRELRMVLESMAAIYNDHIPSKECVESLRKLRNDQGLFQRDELRDYYQPLQHEYLNRLAKTLQIIRKIRVLLRPLINSEESVIHNQQEIQNIRVNVDIQNNILSTFLLDPLSFKDPELFDLIRVFRYDLDEALKKLLTTADTFAAIWKSQFEEPYHEILHIIFKLVWPNDGSKHSYSDENDFLKNN